MIENQHVGCAVHTNTPIRLKGYAQYTLLLRPFKSGELGAMATPRSHVMECMLTKRKHGTQTEARTAAIHSLSMVAALRGALALLLLLGGMARGSESSASPLAWPAVTREAKPWTRWWWMGSIVNPRDLTSQMQEYANAGLGGLEITPIYGVKGEEDRFIRYLTPQWMDMLGHTLKEAERLDMGVDMATGNGWPFGGPWVGADNACKNVAHRTFTLKAGESLAEPVVFVQRPMVRAIGRRVDISDLKEPVGANDDLQALALEQVRFEKPLPLQVLMAYSEAGQVLNLTDKVDADGKLDWVAPAGDWTLYAVFQGWHGKIVERAGPGGEGDVIDHFSRGALDDYLKKFDHAFAGRDIRSLRAFFNDSYEVDDAAGDADWTPRLFDEFRKRRGYDLREHLPALFGKDSPDKNARVLCDYRETISDLLLEEFTIPWRTWSEGKGATMRNQAHGSPANVLDLYAASGIPETEGSDILKFKSASSAAHVTGKRLASSESATWLNEHFVATLGDVKQAVDKFFLGGINHICYHGTTFSPAGEAWPGWLFYASVHFGPTNSFWPDFPALNAYVTRCQSFLQLGMPDNDVLLYYPIYDRWSQPGRSLLEHFDGNPAGTSAREVGQALLDGGYAFDFISDRQIQNLKLTAESPYRAIVVPECRFMPLETFARLMELAKQGFRVIVHENLPTDVPGWGDSDRRRSEYQRLILSLEFRQIGDSPGRIAGVGQGTVCVGDDIRHLLGLATIGREPMVDSGLQFVRRWEGQDRIYWIANSKDEPWDGWVQLRDQALSAVCFDPMSGRSGIVARRGSKARGTEVYLQLGAHQSCIVRACQTDVRGPSYECFKPQGPSVEVQGSWRVRFVSGGPELPEAVEVTRLGSWTEYGGEVAKKFSGSAVYAIDLPRPAGNAEAWLLDLGGVCESAKVTFNGDELGTLIGPPFQIAIPAERMRERNTLEIRVTNLMANRIADLDRGGVLWKKFYNVNFAARLRENRGPDGLFNASKWQPRDSGLIGPVTLTPMDRAFP